LSRRLGIKPQTVFPGFVSRDGYIPGLYRLGQVFVLASRVEAEGIVVLEAAASGLPIVAVRATSMIELIEEPGCGFLVEPGDLATMAERLVSILACADLRLRLGQAARAMASLHTLQRSVELHEALYRRVVEEARATRRAAA
jgi:glycosyltransferase involved in cell wall biosynthesis